MSNLKNHIKLDMPHIVEIASLYSDGVGESFADDRLLFFAEYAMSEKLKQSRDKGRHGWWNSEVCDIEHLHDLLVEHVKKGDMVDVMNFAAMIYVRECADS